MDVGGATPGLALAYSAFRGLRARNPLFVAGYRAFPSIRGRRHDLAIQWPALRSAHYAAETPVAGLLLSRAYRGHASLYGDPFRVAIGVSLANSLEVVTSCLLLTPMVRLAA
jgi:hypothetical protein